MVVDTQEHKVFINVMPLNYPKKNREKMVQMMFETFNVRGLNIENQAFFLLMHLENLPEWLLTQW